MASSRIGQQWGGIGGDSNVLYPWSICFLNEIDILQFYKERAGTKTFFSTFFLGESVIGSLCSVRNSCEEKSYYTLPSKNLLE